MKNTMTGIISINSKGVGFVAPITENMRARNKEEDIQIEGRLLNTAMHGDEVEVKITGKNRWGRVEGEVTKILRRAKTYFVGVLEEDKNAFFLIPDDKRMYMDIMIHPSDILGAKNGEKVQVKMNEWKDPKKNPEGEVVKVLGKKGDNNVEMHAIVLEKGFEIDFPKEVEAEAAHLEKTEKPIKDEEIKKRRDMRGTLTFTIDPFDAKDFDDAISYKKLDNGNVEIGVHIADVSHYVTPGTALDKEARKRAFSVYLVDRTIPMLPELLSNDMCSLNPHEDKLAFSAIFEMTPDAKITDRWFGKTIINSDRRFTYEDAQAIIDGQSARLPSPAASANGGQGDYFSELTELNRIAKIMQKEKFNHGAIDFETEEVKFKLDQNGKPISVYKKERLDTHKLVEEYMLLANREVAEVIFKGALQKKGMASIYRIHDVPQPEKVGDLVLFLKAMGYDLPVKNGSITSRDINKLLKEVQGSPQEALIKTATIRSMAKAIYSTQNIGHFGLAFTYYTHFTSPIRRYPDLIVHRVLYNFLEHGKILPDEFVLYKKIADESSEQEVKAAEAERTSIKMKQVEYMSEHVGEIFEGTISGVTEWGMYVEEKETKCEGMVKLRDMNDDFYSLDQKNYCIVGQNSKKKYSLGDSIKFKVVSADLEQRTLDYSLA